MGTDSPLDELIARSERMSQLATPLIRHLHEMPTGEPRSRLLADFYFADDLMTAMVRAMGRLAGHGFVPSVGVMQHFTAAAEAVLNDVLARLPEEDRAALAAGVYQ